MHDKIKLPTDDCIKISVSTQSFSEKPSNFGIIT